MLDALAAAAEPGAEPFDVVVVGGGITGCGVALDAASRGLSTLLVERDDFASGTSSKSSKMVHGGLRYLQNGDVRLVRQALRERRRLMRNAPHLVELLPFLIPIMTRDGVVSKKIAKALRPAMWMYDASGGWRIGKLHRRVGADEAARHFPTTHLDRLSGGFVYYDASVDDARLTLTIARTAAEHGAVVVNRCPLVALRPPSPDDEATGVTVRADGRDVTVRARCVVNATGVWSDTVHALDTGTDPHSIRPAKGVHISVPWDRVRVDIAVIIPVRSDRRSLFIVPWGPRPDGTFEHAYIGTTDTDTSDPLDHPRCDGDDIDYVLTALDEALDTTTTGPITRQDITGTWAGLRPLVAGPGIDPSSKTADLSRRHRVDVSASGLVTVTGGKLTTYREMAEDTVDVVVSRIGRGGRRSKTKRLALAGARRSGAADDRLARRYGAAADDVRALIAFDATLGEPLVDGLAYVRAEAVHAVRAEMATTLDDVLCRRTRAHLFDRAATLAAAPAIAELLAAELGWDDDEAARQLADYRARCTAEIEAESRHHDSAPQESHADVADPAD